jgi:hypothetical protein
MDSLAKVLKIVFAEHFISLLFLSLSWLFIYGIIAFGDFLSRKILLRAPFYFWIQLNRRKLKLPAWRNAIASGELVRGIVSPDLALEVGKLYGSVDLKISKIRSGKHWITKLLSDESIHIEIVKIADNEWALLESDSALCEATSLDPKASQIGLLSSVGNQNISKSVVLGLLFHSLKFGTPDVKKLALYHIPNKITDSDQLERLESITHTLPASFKQMADEAVNKIRKHLSINSVTRNPQVS